MLRVIEDRLLTAVDAHGTRHEVYTVSIMGFETVEQAEQVLRDHEAMEALRAVGGLDVVEVTRQPTGDLSPPPHCRWSARKLVFGIGNQHHHDDPADAILAATKEDK